MSKLFKSLLATSYKYYDKSVASRLRPYGLKSDDLLDSTLSSDIAVAISRLDPVEKHHRDRRIARAFEITFKKKPLPQELQMKYEPNDAYLAYLVQEAKREREERELLEYF